MKTLIQKLIRPFIILVMLTGIFSLKSFAGGDVYEIYLNNKLIYKQGYKTITGSNELHLGKLNINDRLVIKYSHCGVPGQGRSIVIKDDENNILKEWNFTDTKNNQSVMLIPVKDLLTLKTTAPSLKLYYSAKQLPAGKILAAITLDKNKLAKNTATGEGSSLAMFMMKYFLNPVQFF